jgi:uncharacterized protein YbbC (DUF1343 family)
VRRRSFLAGLGGSLVARDARVATSVAVGLDRVSRGEKAGLAGKRVGLLAHSASVTLDGRHAVDVLRSARVDVVRLFAPEHGVRGRLAAGDPVRSGRDEESGLSVVSLYGDRTKPGAADLAGLDVLVVDLQDAGVRFYTFASTMLLCLEAAAEAGIEVVVLDRPNPLGGVGIDGPEREAEVPTSLLSMAPGPLVHGLTLGEMARLVNDASRRRTRLTVVTMQGWRRAMTWDDTGRPWVSPSPNLRSAEAALAYPGTCLLEATSLSEGRGTERPFLLVGAPWIDAEAWSRAVDVPGFSLEPTRFVPAPSPAAPRPKYASETCAGLRVRVTDRAVARPWVLGLRLLAAARRLAPRFAWARGGESVDTLLGTRAVRRSLDGGQSVESILAGERAGILEFARRRRPALLYR